MWPWEHLAVAYVLYSLWLRFWGNATPGSGETLALVLGSQLPDLVDKPLAWELGILPGGRSLAHSLLFAVPLVLAVGWLAIAADRHEVGGAFALGNLSHLAGDAVHPVFVGGSLEPTYLLWPVLPPEQVAGVTGGTAGYLGVLVPVFLEILRSPVGPTYLVLEAILLAAAVGLWTADGRPGFPPGRPARDRPSDD